MDVRGENDVVFVHRTGSGQIAQSVEQGTENPRVGGSIPSLATLPSPWGVCLTSLLLLANVVGCKPDSCETLCRTTANRLGTCLDAWDVDWGIVDANSKRSYRLACERQWSEERTSLEGREFDDALEQCDEAISGLNQTLQDGTTCDTLRALLFTESE